jgi:hypothetical protein
MQNRGQRQRFFTQAQQTRLEELEASQSFSPEDEVEHERLATLKELSKLIDEKVRPVVSMIEVIAKIAPTEALPILKSTVGAGLDVVEGLDEEGTRFAAVIAKGRRKQYQAYVKAGFSKREAMQMVLAAIRPLNLVESIGKEVEKAGRHRSSRER